MFTLKLFNGWNIPERLKELRFKKSQVQSIERIVSQSDLVEIGKDYRVYQLKGV